MCSDIFISKLMSYYMFWHCSIEDTYSVLHVRLGIVFRTKLSKDETSLLHVGNSFFICMIVQYSIYVRVCRICTCKHASYLYDCSATVYMYSLYVYIYQYVEYVHVNMLHICMTALLRYTCILVQYICTSMQNMYM